MRGLLFAALGRLLIMAAVIAVCAGAFGALHWFPVFGMVLFFLLCGSWLLLNSRRLLQEFEDRSRAQNGSRERRGPDS